MTVLAFLEDDRFIVRIIKSLTTNPDNEWVNSYEFRAVSAAGESVLLNLVNDFVVFEQNIHRTTVIFQRALASTWEEDSVPYNPENFLTSTLTGTGLLEVVDDVLALDQCLSVTRICGFGRVGHIYYRGALEEAQVAAPAGKSVLTDRTAWQGVIDDAVAESGIDQYFGQDASSPLRLVMINRDGTQVRPVITLRAQGVASVKTDHKWFNRTTPA